MSDNLRRYRALRHALAQGYPTSSLGNCARHLHTLAARISGLVGSKSPPLPPIAMPVPDGPKPASRGKRFARWGDNAHIREEVDVLPSAAVWLRPLAGATGGLGRDGGGGGRGCPALMIPVVDKGRALPRAWRVRPAPPGHFPEELHIALGARISGLLPAEVQVGLLGAGECAGTRRQPTLPEGGWAYACRTATSTVAAWEGEPFRLDAGGACRKPGRLLEVQDVQVTREASGPIMVLCGGAKG